MKTLGILLAIVKADFLDRTRRTSFVITLCMIIYLGYAVNTGQIFIKLETYRGIYNSAWVGSLMALVITFFLGIAGFYLVKNSIERDKQTGVGQIIATTSLTRSQYLLGKWLSNFAVLSSLVTILALAAVLMQLIQRESPQLQIWPLIAPLILVALPMMALVAAIAVFFEAVPWLSGGFGNLAYFGVFIFLFTADIFLTQLSWLDVTGVSLVGSSMKAAAKQAYPGYQDSFVLSMASDQAVQTFVWQGLDWTAGLILQRLMWLVVSVGVVLSGSLFFNRFDPNRQTNREKKQTPVDGLAVFVEETAQSGGAKLANLTPLANNRPFRYNIFRLVRLECLLLVKGLKWYWLAGMGVLWVGSILAPSASMRDYWFIMIAIWPVLIWSRMGEREVRYQTEQLLYQAAYPLARLLGPSWLAGVVITAAAASGVLIGRLIAAEPIALLPWLLSVIFIPTFAILLGIWSRGSKLFEAVYPILWYLGPFNRENGLILLDYLGIHEPAPVNSLPLQFAGFLLLLLLLALLGRRRQILV